MQWTSPLRRSLDLEAHWQLKKWLLKVQAQEFAAENAAAADTTAAGVNAPGANEDKRHHDSAGSSTSKTWYYDPYEAMDKAALSALLQDRAKVSRHAGAVQRETTNYWLLGALRRGPPSPSSGEASSLLGTSKQDEGATAVEARNPRYEAVVLGPAPPTYTSDHAVLLVEIGCELVLRGDNKPSLEPGTTVTLEFEECNPRLGTYTLTRAT